VDHAPGLRRGDHQAYTADLCRARPRIVAMPLWTATLRPSGDQRAAAVDSEGTASQRLERKCLLSKALQVQAYRQQEIG
jgi:hypothetical protein